MYHKTRKKLGFMVDSLNPSELSLQLTHGSLDVEELDVILFFQKISRAPTFHLCSHMHVSEAYSFDGPVIATDLQTAFKLLSFPSPKPKFFFLNDLEWVHYQQKNYETLEAVYRNRELTLLARCEDHARLIESCWNRSVEYIVPNYKFFDSGFLKFLEGKISSAPKYVNPPIIYKPILQYI